MALRRLLQVYRNLTLSALIFAYVASAMAQVPLPETEPVIGMPQPPEMPKISEVGSRTETVEISTYAAVRYVAPTGNDAQADGSQAKPYSSPAAALAAITDASSDKRYAVLVAAGEYEVSGLQLKPHVDLFGGYNPESWNQRDIDKHPTVLDAREKGQVAIAADDARLDGFRITGGKFDGMGGAMLIDGTAPILSNNVFHHNRTIHTEEIASGTLHTLGHVGGAIAVLNGARPEIRQNLIVDNSTDVGDGGAIAIRESAPRIVGNVIVNNHTGLNDTTMYDNHIGSRSSNGAGLSLTASEAEVTGNVIALNQAHYINDGGAIYLEFGDRSRIVHNWLVGNTTSDDGGAIYVRGLEDYKAPENAVTIENNIFAGNRIYNEERQKFSYAEAIFLSKLGRAHVEGNLMIHQRAGIGVANSVLTALRNVIVANDEAGIYVDLRQPGVPRSRIEGNLMSGNGRAQIEFVRRESEIPAASGNFVQGGFDEGGNNIALEPKFEEPVRLTITARQAEPLSGSTEFQVQGELPQDLAGRVAGVGEQWSVIREAGAGRVVLWGNVSDDAGELVIAPTYRTLR